MASPAFIPSPHLAAKEIAAQVDKICRHKPLNKSDRGIQLLRYLVNAVVQGVPASHLKEVVIGVEVFGLPHDFNPKKNSIVRVSIGSLRVNLNLYYETTGRADHIRISIPTGSYVPQIYYQPSVAAFAINNRAAMCIANAKAALDQRTLPAYTKSLKYLNLALEHHPAHPRILSLQAMCHAARAMYGGDPRADLNTASSLIAQAALSEHLPWERLVVEAWLKMTLHFDWPAAEPLFQQAISLSHGEAQYHTWYTAYLFSQLRMEEGLELVQAAVTHAADDQSFRRFDFALCQIMAGHLDDAAETLTATFDLFPQAHYMGFLHKAILQEAQGRIAEAAATIQSVPITAKESTMVAGIRALFIGLSGDRPKAQKEYRHLLAIRKRGKSFIAALQLTNAALGAGQPDEAVHWLQEAIAEHDPMLCWITLVPFTRHLHAIPAAREIIAKQLRLKFPSTSNKVSRVE